MKAFSYIPWRCLLAWTWFLTPLALRIAAQARFTYTTNADNTATITGYTGPGGVVAIPDTIDGLLVTGIGGSAFFNTAVTSVAIPNSVTDIGLFAFAQCPSLSNVFFMGNAPAADWTAFVICPHAVLDYLQPYSYNVTAEYLRGADGWSDFSANTDVSVMPWFPLIQTSDGNIGVRNNQFGFNISWANGKTVKVEACASLANPIWTLIATNTLSGDSLRFSDPQSTNYPSRFYRLKQE